MIKDKLTWKLIDASMHTFRPTEGGYSLAKRGIVTLPDGSSVFVKLATEENSERFIPKEVSAYNFLKNKGYKHVPELLLSKPDGIVLPNLSHLDWSNSWDERKLDAVLAAMDELSGMFLNEVDKKLLPDVVIENGWQALLEDKSLYDSLLDKLSDRMNLQKAVRDNIVEYAKISEEYLSNSSQKVLIHADIRADNLAYNPENREVYIIDWNWMGLGGKGLEDAGLMVNVAHSGFDVESKYSERIDRTGSLVLAGFWFCHSTRRIWTGGDPNLRDLQFKNALQVSKWAKIGL